MKTKGLAVKNLRSGAFAVIVGVLAGACTERAPALPEQATATARGNLVDRAQELRESIQAAYRQLESAGGVKPIGQGGNDITAAIAGYFQEGSSLPEAEQLLREAGFTVGPHLENFIGRGPVIFANLPVNRFEPFSNTKITISLRPARDPPWTTLDSATASVVRASL